MSIPGSPASSPCGDDAVTLWRFTETSATGVVRHHHYAQPKIYSNGHDLDGIEGRWLALPAYQRLVAERDDARALATALVAALGVDSSWRGGNTGTRKAFDALVAHLSPDATRKTKGGG